MMEIYYVNSENVKLDLTHWPYRMQTGDIFNYEWSYDHSSGTKGRINSFTKEIVTKGLTLTVAGTSERKYEEAVDHFFQTVETDVLNVIPGKLYFNGQYLKCYIYCSEKSEWEYGDDSQDNEIKIVTDCPYWTKETEYIFKASDTTSTNNKRYSNRYAHRYANGLTNASLQNDNFTESNFRMIVYGPVVKPLVIVGGYKYYVDVVLEDGEYLEIDSAAGTIFKVMATGIRVNCFHNRGLVDSVFRPIQAGRQTIDWSGKFDFDIILYEERSQPRWQ